MIDRSVVKYLLLVTWWTSKVLPFNVDTDTPFIFKGPRNTYFGYSVAILENTQGTWLLVGAPRANDSSLPGVREPGAVFQCNWQYRSSCQPVDIDSVGNERQIFSKWKNVTVQHNKDNQWLGASIDVNIHGKSQVMICAPRWVDHKFYVQGIQLMNGLCYESDRELHFDDSSAWPILEYWKKQVHAEGYFSYGMGSLGTSASYSRDGLFSVLGAPGLNDWSGGFALIDEDSTSRPSVMELPIESENNSYFGMSIATAKLSADGVFTIVGGPRAGGYGKVHAYNSKFQFLLAEEGDQLGSLFGASVCAVDLNGDGLDDLVVGAPLYVDILDEGRVYVYVNKDFFTLQLLDPLLKGSNTPGARFGTAVANVGDLNLDKFEDIAVGAPFEAESGVVYIYNGASFGIYSEPSQRIVGKDLLKDLQAFGWSFSRPWDVDGNHYEDFAVGAFESNRVVLLRTRSVVDLFASLEVSPAIIDMNSKPDCQYRGQPFHCLEAFICLRYTGRNLPPSSEVNVTLQLDTLERHRGERSRLFIQGSDNTQIDTINELITLRWDRVICARKYTVYVHESRDVITPLQLDLEFDIASSSIGIASMCTICPIRNKYNPRTTREMAFFALDCGPDHVCKPELDIQTRPVFSSGRDYFMIDDSPYFDLEMTVSNSGEISYLTIITVGYPASMIFTSATVIEGQTTVWCMPAREQANITLASLTCDIMHPVRTGDTVVVSARFYAHGVPYGVHQLEMKTTVSTAGKSDNVTTQERAMSLTVPVQMKTEMKLLGASVPGYLSLPREMIDAETEQWFPLTHLYILSNFGPSPMPHGQLIFQVPAADWLKLINVEIDTRTVGDTKHHVPVECSMSAGQGVIDSTEGHAGLQIEKSRDSFVTFVNCNSSTCSTVGCYVGVMHKSETIYINISMTVRVDVLRTLKVDDQLGLTSSGILKEPDYVSYTSLTSTSNITTTTYIMYQAPPKQAVTWWVLVISISSGLLLLYILAVILWKCGFFRRKQREELQMLVKSSEAERELLNSDSLSAGSSDVMVLPASQNRSSSNHVHREQGLFFYPHLEPNDGEADHNLDNHFFQSHSLNRRHVNPAFPHAHNFHTLQYNHNSNHPRSGAHRNGSAHVWSRNGDPRNGHHRPGVPQDSPQRARPQPNIWVAPPAAPSPPPSFNNEMYLEPLESRA